MFSDLTYALRLLVKNRSFTLIAVLTLGVGIGSATVIFSAVNALFLRPLPLIKDGDRLLYVTQTNLKRGYDDMGVNYPDFRDLKARITTLEGIWLHGDRTVIIDSATEPERLLGTEISTDAFSLMGVEPILGRNFKPEDELPNSSPVVLLSYKLWERRFGRSPEILNTAVTINGTSATVIGVMPKGWGYPDYTELWTPLRPVDEKMQQRGSYWLSARAKLKQGATLEQAQTEAASIMAALALEHKASNENVGVRLRPIREEAIEEASQSTKLLFAAVLFVFLIACLNVANLLLARASSRTKEIAVRLALGAERGRLIRQLLTESALLGLLGGAAGLLLALWGLDLMVAAFPIEVPFWMRFDFDYRVFVFATALSLVSAFLFGLAPALRATRPILVNELKEGGRTSEDAAPQSSRLRNILVVAEVAIALVLLIAAGLLVRSFYELRNVDPGYNRENLLTFRTGFPVGMDKDEEAVRRFFLSVEERVKALPGVISAGLTTRRYQDSGTQTHTFLVEGMDKPATLSELPIGSVQTVSPSFFETMQIGFLAGRNFNVHDKPDSPLVAIVDQNLAVKYFGSPQNAVGKRLRGVGKEDEAPKWVEIVGVVQNVLQRPDSTHQLPASYGPATQDRSNFMSVVLRVKAAPISYAEAVRLEVLKVNRGIPIYDVFTMEDIFVRSVWTRHFFSRLFTVSGLIALFLACIGIYGVMTYNVSLRAQELGMRMALGAQPGEVIRLVLRKGLSLVGIGLGLGLVGAFFAMQLLASSLYGVSPHDPPTFGFVLLLLVLVSAVACYLPSRRITRIDPNAALRCE